MFYKIKLFLYLLLLCPEISTNVVVTTKYGKISGKVFKTVNGVDYYGFMGIPYAAPPVGDFKFLPPQPVDFWTGIITAHEEKPPCIQYNTNIKKGQPMGIVGSEDCLYLDIFSQELNDKQPVLVFLHNENFRNSHNKSRDYSPDYFVEQGLTVVVITHRLSVYGFLNLEDDTVPGNAGLKDIVAGLEWVKDNIQKFGGDNSKVTLLGVNGGAAAVDLLLRSKANFLFHSVILQSGTSLSPVYLQEGGKDRAFKLAEEFGIKTKNKDEVLKELRKLNPEQLLKIEFRAVDDDYFKNEQKGILSFGPVLEINPNGLITNDTLNKHDPIDKPIMMGFNSQEGLEPCLQYLIEPRYIYFIEKDFPLFMPRRSKFKFDPLDETSYEAKEDIKKFYFKKGTFKDQISGLITYIGDVLTSFPVDETARYYSGISKQPVFYYNFDYSSQLNANKVNLLKLSSVDGVWGAASGDELCYLFKCPDLIAEYSKLSRTSSKVLAAQKRIVTMWTNFVKYGDPTPDDSLLEGQKWLPYNTDSRKYLHISDKIEMQHNLYEERFEFWRRFLGKWEKRAVNGIVKSSKFGNKEEL